MRNRLLLLGALLGHPLHAQATGAVTGIVFDSIAGAPLRGAVVQVALVRDTGAGGGGAAAPRTFSATTDDAGRYRIVGLPTGQFAIGFQHDALNAMGLESPLRAFESRGDSSATVNLAVPNGPVVRAQLCGRDMRLAGEGVAAGYVREARREAMLPGAVVRARWLELALERGNYRTVTRVVTAIVGADGRYVACGLTSDERVAVEVSMPGYRTVTHSLAVPGGGAVRQDFRLADSGAVSASGSVAGRVVLPDGSPLASGVVVFGALALEVPVRDGRFSVASLPAGSWAAEGRVIGYEPQAVLVEVPAGGVASPTITLSDRTRVLDAITVKGRRGERGDAKILSAIESRRRTTTGTVFLPGDVYLESSYHPSDVVRGAAGFRYVSEEVLLSSGCGYRYPPPDQPTMALASARGRTKTLAVYLDGARVHGGLPELRTAVTMRDVLAMEAYQDISTAPLEWRTNDACAVLAIWTKR